MVGSFLTACDECHHGLFCVLAAKFACLHEILDELLGLGLRVFGETNARLDELANCVLVHVTSVPVTGTG